MSLFDELTEAITRYPRVGRHELYCHPNVYSALRRMTDYQSTFPPHPLDMFFGAVIVVVPELGAGVWEWYTDGKLIDYGKMK